MIKLHNDCLKNKSRLANLAMYKNGKDSTGKASTKATSNVNMKAKNNVVENEDMVDIGNRRFQVWALEIKFHIFDCNTVRGLKYYRNNC